MSLVSTIESQRSRCGESDPNATAASFLRHERVVGQREAKADLRAALSLHPLPRADAPAATASCPRKMDLIVSIGLRTDHAKPCSASSWPYSLISLNGSPCLSFAAPWTCGPTKSTRSPSHRDDHDAPPTPRTTSTTSVTASKLDAFFGKEQGMRVMALNSALDQQYRSRKPAATTDTSGVTTADNVAASTGAQRADAFINAIINPVLASGLLPTCGGAPATVCVTIPFDRLQTPGQPADSTDIATRMSQNTMRHHSATIRPTNGPGDALISPHRAAGVVTPPSNAS